LRCCKGVAVGVRVADVDIYHRLLPCQGKASALQDAIRARDHDIAVLRDTERALLERSHESSLERGLTGPGASRADGATGATEVDEQDGGLVAAGGGVRSRAMHAVDATGATMLTDGDKVGKDADVGEDTLAADVKGGRAWELEGVRARLRERREQVREEEAAKEMETGTPSYQEIEAVLEGEGTCEQASVARGHPYDGRRESEDDGDVSVEEFGEDFMLDLIHHPAQVPCLHVRALAFSRRI
jgi:hypothetical protein